MRKYLPRGWPKRRTQRGTDGSAEGRDELYLESLGASVSLVDSMVCPGLGEVLSEDCCWRIAVADWRVRRPSIWQCDARARWREEGQQLAELRARIAALARTVDLWPLDASA